MTVHRRRIYIIPTRFGVALSLLLVSMLIAGLNYNSNLGLAFAFLMTSLALVAMHHCHRNLLSLGVDAATEADAFVGGFAHFDFLLHNEAGIERCEIEIRCEPPRDGVAPATGGHGVSCTTVAVAPRSYARATVAVPALRRGVVDLERFELRTRYPFGWFRAWTYVQSPLTLFIAPEPLGSRTLPPAAAAAAESPAEVRGDDDFAGLRAYEPGISLKHMAWKVLARGGEPAVRSYSSLAAQPEWLDWAVLHGLPTETRLAQLCRWVVDRDASQRSYGLRLPGSEIVPSRGPVHRTACLRALARYAPDAGRET